jgi:2-polyprenyl-3-methyl-5-hydroxy-6-metoxy-1,4-benzoquinol methylase
MLMPVNGLVERLSAGCRVLELGCGGGWALETLAEESPASVFLGNDLDEYGLGLASDRLARFGDRCRVERRDVQDLAENCADVVLAIDLVHDLPDPVGSLARIRKALALGGIFVMAETEPWGVQPERSTRASHSVTSARRRSGCSWGSA